MDPKYKKFAPWGYWLSFASLLVTGGLYFVYRVWNTPVQVALVLTFTFLALALAVDPQRATRALGGRQARFGANAVVMALAVAGILVVVNYMVYSDWNTRWDLTEEQLNTLTDETMMILDLLEEPVHVMGFFTASSGGSEDYAREILDDYVFFSDGQVSYEFVDPEASPVQAQEAGITQDRSLLVTMGEKQEVITYASEQELTGAILRLVSGDVRTVYFLTGHGEYDIDGTGDTSYSVVKQTLESKGYIVNALNLLALQAIPEDANVIVIAGPMVPVTAEEMALIAEFMNNGGALIALLEPPALTEVGSGPDPLADYLTESWDVLLGNDIVVDLQTQSGLQAVAYEYGTHPITQKMDQVAVVFPSARSVRPGGTLANLNVTELVLTAPFDTTWAETDIEMLAQGAVEPDENTDIPGPVTIALAVEDFALGSRVAVFGDSDFPADGSFYQQRNGDMLINAVDWASEQEALINLTPRTPTQRFMLPPFPLYTNVVMLMTVCVLPGIVFGAGMFVFWMRRRRT